MSRAALARLTILVTTLAILLLAATAVAQTPGSSAARVTTRTPTTSAAGSVASDPNALTEPGDLTTPPPGRLQTANRVLRIADAVPKVVRERRKYPGSTRKAFLKGSDRWQVSYYAPPRFKELPSKEIAQVLIDDRSGEVREAWTGYQVAWTMARGYEGAFGRKANSPIIWIALCVAFVVPFLRPPLRLLHLDLAVLLAFSISYAYFNAARIDVSVPIVYPLLVYLLARMIGIAVARGRTGQSDLPTRAPLRLLTPEGFLSIAVIFLLGFRIGLNVTNSNVIDVGYAGVIGADRLEHGDAIWGNFPMDNQRGDTYGPIAYLAYVPFELLWPWKGTWDDLPAAHAAAITFDLACVLVLWLLGRRVQGPLLGVLLAYCWVAFPFTLLVSNSNSNDALVGALVVLALLTVTSAPARGALAAIAGMTKFAPLALIPLFATFGTTTARRRQRLSVALVVGGAATIALAVMLVPVAFGGDLATFYNRTVGFQGDRGSPFSIWGYHDNLNWAQTLTEVAAVVFAVIVAFVPRRRDTVSLAALSAAVLIAAQLTVTHWFYLYMAWFLPVMLVALLAAQRVEAPAGRPAATKRAGAAAPSVSRETVPTT